MSYKKSSQAASPKDRCDIKIWSGDCRHTSYQSDGEKYLCTSCGTLSHLDHEVVHQFFPYVCGDYDSLI